MQGYKQNVKEELFAMIMALGFVILIGLGALGTVLYFAINVLK